MSSIGVGITTKGRYEVFKKTYNEWVKRLPKGAKLVVVDDNSATPVPEATHRHSTTWGISRSKNHCLELLDDCNHIFLADDDCYPVSDDWYKPYIESPEPHLMYVFTEFAVPTIKPLKDCKEIYRDEKLVAYTHARGCLLYIDRKILDVVGGMDTAFGGSMFEHSEWSNRIYNAGLTLFRVMDVPQRMFHSMDEWVEVASSITLTDRKLNLIKNRQRYLSSQDGRYCEYRQNKGNNIILTAFFTSQVDPQSGKRWEADFSKLNPLIKSIKHNKLVVLHDCFDLNDSNYIKVKTYFNPYFQRWFEYFKYLREHPEIDHVYIVDSTDTEMLKEPSWDMGDALYVGSEDSHVGTPWMLKHNNDRQVKQFLQLSRTKRLLNCGIVGGSRKNIMDLSRDIYTAYFEGKTGPFEMGIFNMLCYTKYKTLPASVTRFKAYDYKNTEKEFRHK